MARETRDIADELGYASVFIAQDAVQARALSEREDVILESDIAQLSGLECVIGIGDGAIRQKIASRFLDTVSFVNLIHPSATFGLGQRRALDNRIGVIVCAGVRFTCDITVGNFAIFNINSSISHDSVIHDFVTVCPQACVLGNVEIEDRVWVGAGATINQGCKNSKRKIGKNTIIGSGALVLHDCDSDCVYAGVPARKLR